MQKKIEGIDALLQTALDSIPNLTQVEPLEGAPPFAQTIVRILTTGDAIVIGVRAEDPEPSRIVSFAAGISISTSSPARGSRRR